MAELLKTFHETWRVVGCGKFSHKHLSGQLRQRTCDLSKPEFLGEGPHGTQETPWSRLQILEQ